MQVLERFRWLLLQRFRSLFDAFARLHDLATRQNALTQEEFVQSFAQIGIKEAQAVGAFAAMDSKGKQIVSLAELRTALVTSSKKALLWELRCRLLTQGITSNDFSKVKKILEVARRPRHRTVRQRRRPTPYAWAGQMVAATIPQTATIPQDDLSGNIVDTGVEESEGEQQARGDAGYAWAENYESRIGFLPSCPRLSRTDWLQLCSAIGLTLSEAERLFEILVNHDTRMVDLQEMFTVLRAGVAPHVSLERFATRVLTRYGSLQLAFSAATKDGTASVEDEKAAAAAGVAVLMSWPQFQSLAEGLDVSDDNAEGLWAALTLAQRSAVRENEDDFDADLAIQEIKEDSGAILALTSGQDNPKKSEDLVLLKNIQHKSGQVEAITELIFVKELTVWAPGTALGTLRNQVDEHFSDLSEFRYALGQTGLQLSAPITPAELDTALSALGITCSNVESVCNAVRSAWRGNKGVNISINDIVQALNSSGTISGCKNTVRDDLRSCWQVLHNVQADLQGTNKESPNDLCLTDLQASFKHLSGRRRCSGNGGIRCSASLPCLRKVAGLRTRQGRHTRSRQGMTT
jgi:hypothetical protein